MPTTLGVLLAGGLATRLGGGDKSLRTVAGEPILAHAIARLRPQCTALLINANGDPHRFATFGLPVIADTIPGFAGPLAGVLAALEWTAENRPDISAVVSVPADCPFLPIDLVARLHRARPPDGRSMPVATSGMRRHHVVALWNVAMRDDLRHALAVDGLRKVSDWIDRHAPVTVDWPADPVDPFFNVNTADDLAGAEQLVRQEPSFR